MKAICGVQLKDRKTCTYLMFMLGLSENIGQLAMKKQCSLVWSCVEVRGWSCFEKGIIF